MKKLVSLLLVLVLSFSIAAPAMAATRDVVVEPVVVNILEQSASAWYAEDAARVLFVTCMLLDVALGENQTLNDIAVNAVANNRAYIALSSDGRTLTVFFFGASQCLAIIYNPTLKTNTAMVSDISGSSASSFMSQAKSEGLYRSYYMIPGDDVMTMLEILTDMLGN